MAKKIMRTAKEKEKIVKEYRNTPITIRAIAEKYHTVMKNISEWVNKYEKYAIKGLESQTGRKKGGSKGQSTKKLKMRNIRELI